MRISTSVLYSNFIVLFSCVYTISITRYILYIYNRPNKFYLFAVLSLSLEKINSFFNFFIFVLFLLNYECELKNSFILIVF